MTKSLLLAFIFALLAYETLQVIGPRVDINLLWTEYINIDISQIFRLFDNLFDYASGPKSEIYFSPFKFHPGKVFFKIIFGTNSLERNMKSENSVQKNFNKEFLWLK